MSRRGQMAPEVIRFALADSIAFYEASDSDRVSARSGLSCDPQRRWFR